MGPTGEMGPLDGPLPDGSLPDGSLPDGAPPVFQSACPTSPVLITGGAHGSQWRVAADANGVMGFAFTNRDANTSTYEIAYGFYDGNNLKYAPWSWSLPGPPSPENKQLLDPVSLAITGADHVHLFGVPGASSDELRHFSGNPSTIAEASFRGVKAGAQITEIAAASSPATLAGAVVWQDVSAPGTTDLKVALLDSQNRGNSPLDCDFFASSPPAHQDAHPWKVALAVSPDGTKVAASFVYQDASSQNDVVGVVVWDVSPPRCSARAQYVIGGVDVSNGSFPLTVFNDGEAFVAGSDANSNLFVWDCPSNASGSGKSCISSPVDPNRPVVPASVRLLRSPKETAPNDHRLAVTYLPLVWSVYAPRVALSTGRANGLLVWKNEPGPSLTQSLPAPPYTIDDHLETAIGPGDYQATGGGDRINYFYETSDVSGKTELYYVCQILNAWPQP